MKLNIASWIDANGSIEMYRKKGVVFLPPILIILVKMADFKSFIRL
jgi:hypothetical protein